MVTKTKVRPMRVFFRLMTLLALAVVVVHVVPVTRLETHAQHAQAHTTVDKNLELVDVVLAIEQPKVPENSAPVEIPIEANTATAQSDRSTCKYPDGSIISCEIVGKGLGGFYEGPGLCSCYEYRVCDPCINGVQWCMVTDCRGIGWKDYTC